MMPSTFSYIEYRPASNDGDANVVGGALIRTTAAGALLVGDTVYFSASGKVNKTATAATLAAFAGVVVGGKLTGMRVPDDTAVSGQAATDTDGDEVLVQRDGVVYAIAGGTITVGTHLSVIGGTTAGQLIAGTTAGVRVGTPITDGVADGFFKMLINQR